MKHGLSKVVGTFELTQISCPVPDAMTNLREAQDPSSASRSLQRCRDRVGPILELEIHGMLVIMSLLLQIHY